jgi:hypothetical protein
MLSGVIHNNWGNCVRVNGVSRKNPSDKEVKWEGTEETCIVSSHHDDVIDNKMNNFVG